MLKLQIPTSNGRQQAERENFEASPISDMLIVGKLGVCFSYHLNNHMKKNKKISTLLVIECLTDEGPWTQPR
jgi:hypothetical protein